MATVAECEQALTQLAGRLAGLDDEARKRHVVERTLACRIRDLDVTFTGRLGAEGLMDICVGEIRSEAEREAQLRLLVSSDDLIKLVQGDLGVASAWASGRLKIDASVLDILRLRSML